MRAYFTIIIIVFFMVLVSCNHNQKLGNLENFYTEKKGNYLLFHFSSPLENDGYISEVDEKGKVIKKYNISDKHFAPSDVFHYGNNYYFASGAYSNDNKLIKYNPINQKLSKINSKQKKHIEKYFEDDKTKYIITTLDKYNNNEFCNITINKCYQFDPNYRTHDITILDSSLIAVGINKNADRIFQKDLVKIRKYDQNMKIVKEVTLDYLPHYFTYTSPTYKLYMFMYNGDIVEINSNLDVNTYPLKINFDLKDITGIRYNKNVMLDDNNILVNIEIKQPNNKSTFIAKVSLIKGTPNIEVLQNSSEETILNVDYDNGEVYTRSYTDNKTTIKIRDSETLETKNTIILNNNDAIYFVDNIK